MSLPATTLSSTALPAAASTGTIEPGRPAVHPRSRPRLRVVTAPPATRSRTPFVLACAALMAVTLLGLLMLNIALSRGAYHVHELEAREALLAEREQTLSEQLAALEAPQSLAERAEQLGMVPAADPIGLRLSDATLVGAADPAAPPPETSP